KHRRGVVRFDFDCFGGRAAGDSYFGEFGRVLVGGELPAHFYDFDQRGLAMPRSGNTCSTIVRESSGNSAFSTGRQRSSRPTCSVISLMSNKPARILALAESVVRETM